MCEKNPQVHFAGNQKLKIIHYQLEIIHLKENCSLKKEIKVIFYPRNGFDHYHVYFAIY